MGNNQSTNADFWARSQSSSDKGMTDVTKAYLSLKEAVIWEIENHGDGESEKKATL